MQASAQKRGRALALTLAASRAGNVAALFALGLPILVGITGLGVEAGLWYASKRQLQTAADAAAVAGALERAAGGGVEAAALDAAAKNGASATGGTTVTVNTPPASGPNAGDPTAVEAIVTRHQQALLSGMFLADGLTVSARAVAKVAGKGKACVLALDPTASGAITNLGSATVDLGGCMIAANSIDDTAITFGGNASVTAGSLWTAGNYSVSGSAGLSLEDPATTHASRIADPYADLVIPGFNGCAPENSFKNETKTISPGVFCGGMSFGAHADITLEPGTYYIDGGDLTANAQAEIHGTGVTIVLTSSGAAGDIGSVHINGNSSVSLTAPSDGPFAGLVIVQDRRAPSDGTSVFNGGASMSFGGMLYFPSQGVRFNGNNDTNALACTEIIARLVTFTGDAGFTDSGCEAAGVTSPQAGGAQLAE